MDCDSVDTASICVQSCIGLDVRDPDQLLAHCMTQSVLCTRMGIQAREALRANRTSLAECLSPESTPDYPMIEFRIGVPNTNRYVLDKVCWYVVTNQAQSSRRESPLICHSTTPLRPQQGRSNPKRPLL